MAAENFNFVILSLAMVKLGQKNSGRLNDGMSDVTCHLPSSLGLNNVSLYNKL